MGSDPLYLKFWIKWLRCSEFRPMRKSVIVRFSFGSYRHVCFPVSISEVNFIVGCSTCTMSSYKVHVRYLISWWVSCMSLRICVCNLYACLYFVYDSIIKLWSHVEWNVMLERAVSVSGRFSPLPASFPLCDLPLRAPCTFAPSFLPCPFHTPLHPIFGPLRSVFRSTHMLYYENIQLLMYKKNIPFLPRCM